MRRKTRCLVVVADDFGRSSSVNRAVVEAHQKGVVSAASVMAGGEAFDDATRICRRVRSLSVGLHATLCDGRSVLSRGEIPGLVDEDGRFEPDPIRAWMKYSDDRLLPQLDREIGAQFDRLAAYGIQAHHVDGHHHLHVHPGIFRLVCKHAANRGIGWIRLPREPLGMVLRANGRGAMPLLEWVYFRVVDGFRRKQAVQYGLRAADAVYGLSRTGRMDEQYFLRALNRGGNVVEIFAHPDCGTPEGSRELQALTSPRVAEYVSTSDVLLVGYDGVTRNCCRVPDGAETGMQDGSVRSTANGAGRRGKAQACRTASE